MLCMLLSGKGAVCPPGDSDRLRTEEIRFFYYTTDEAPGEASRASI